LRLASHVGKDSAQAADILIGQVKQVSEGQSPFFVSDGRSYGEALMKHYSTEVQPDPTQPKRGRPRKQLERRRDPDLLYGQAIKDKDSRGRVVSVHRRMVFGSAAELRERFREIPRNQLLTTNHIERDHLTSRTHNSRLVRRSITYSKVQAPLQWQCDLDDLYYNFCLPHSSLRQELPEPIPTRGTGSPKRWEQRTPAMAEGLTDHIMTLTEVLSIPALPQCHHNIRGP
jgi:hypothetical protein